MREKTILVIGSINIDHIMRVHRFPQPGETVKGNAYDIVAGGKGANQAVACARLGGRTSFIASIGMDDPGREMVRQFEKDGVDVSMIEACHSEKTGVALIFVEDGAENIIGIHSGANESVSPERIKSHEAAIGRADYLLMQLEIPLESVIAAATLAGAYGTKVILDPAPAIELPDELLSRVDVITPNQTEAELLTGVKVRNAENAQLAASKLHAKGIDTVIITMGSLGAYVSTQSENNLIAGENVKSVDTTAAGDTFNGGLCVGLAKGMTISDTVKFANLCAAISVTRMGAQASITHIADVNVYGSEFQIL